MSSVLKEIIEDAIRIVISKTLKAMRQILTKKNLTTHFLLGASFLLCGFEGCSDKSSLSSEASENEVVAVPEVVRREKPKVTVRVLEQGIFYKEVLGNGKLVAVQRSNVKFRISEEIEKIYVRNGDRVKSGELLVELEPFIYEKRLEQVRNQISKQELDLKDFLLGMGFGGKDSSQVPEHIWDLALVRSGLREARHSLVLAQHDFQNTKVRAPISGLIANVQIKEYNLASGDFCTIINDSVFEAEFSVLESELSALFMNQSVIITPFARGAESFQGHVSAINPMVDANGLVQIKARVNNNNGIMFEGMNVRVAVRYAVPDRLIVLKEAVVLRGSRTVIFTLEEGRAMWKDVRIGEENSTQYAILEGLTPGCTVIVSGNLNLGHDTEVELINQ